MPATAEAIRREMIMGGQGRILDFRVSGPPGQHGLYAAFGKQAQSAQQDRRCQWASGP